MAKFSLVAGVRVPSVFRIQRFRCSSMLRALAVLFVLLAARPAQAQTALSINTHWADGAKCTCTITIKQMNSNGTTTTVFQGVTDDTGHLSGSSNLQVQGVYSIGIVSNSYGIPLFSLPFSTGLVAALPLKSATLNLVFSRPSLNGQPIPCCTVPANYTPPALVAGSSVQFGI
jgi:hypothetical protein